MKFGTHVPESVIEQTKLRIHAAIDALEQDAASHHGIKLEKAPTNKRSLQFIYTIAASMLLTVLSVVYYADHISKAGRAPGLFATEVQKTPKGKKQHLLLEDGTEVWLNANSVLKYEKNFADQAIREVYLEGEAFFDVTHDEKRPFIVRTSGLAIRVLGTTFNVRSYAEDHVVETTLVDGKVTIASGSEDRMEPVTLLPNQQALFSKNSKTMALEAAVNTENYIAWRNGWMIFDDKPFRYIKETLERWYDVSIVMEDENSLSCSFSAKFQDKTLQEVLEIFKMTESISYRIVGNQVFIDGRLCEY
jgi:transmembrane sensor